MSIEANKEVVRRYFEEYHTTTLRIRDGRIAAILGTHWDHLGILQQMGVVETATPRPGA